MLVRPRDDAALGGDRYVEDVGGGRIAGRLDLDAVAQRAPAQDPTAGRDLGADARDHGLAEADEPGREVDGDGRRVQRAERRPAREGDGHRLAGEVVRLAPPPDRREAVPPVALDVGGGAVQRPALAELDEALGAGPQDERAPVLAHEGRPAGGPGAVPRPRPGHDVVQVGVHPRARHDRAQPLGLAGEGGADPDAARVGHRAVEDRRPPGVARPGGDAGQRPARADAAQHDRGPPVGPGEPPEPAVEGGPAQFAEALALASSQARTKPSRSPSSTRSALPTSKSVRWSLTIVYGCRT